MTATTTANPTARDKLIASAEKMMLERGYHATTVDEMCADAGVSKGSFYHFFASKEDLGLAALENYYENGMQRLLSGPFQQESDPRKRLFDFLRQTESRAVDFWGRGCLLGTFAIDLAGAHPVIQQRVATQFDRLTERLAELFAPVTETTTSRSSARDLAASYLATIEGGIVMARAFGDPGRIRDALVAFRRQLERATEP